MKGVIFNILESFLDEKVEPGTWFKLRDACPVHHHSTYVGPETYPDEELFTLVGNICAHLELEPQQALYQFGRYLFGGLAQRYPSLIERFDDLPSLLAGVDRVIHVEVAKLLVDARTPAITLVDANPEGATVHYQSSRKLCFLAQGLLDGAAEHFGLVADSTQGQCMHEGAEHCVIQMQLRPAKAVA